MEDLYKILGVAKNAAPEEIRKAFRDQAKELHPDVNSSPEAKRRFQALNEANSILSNRDKRAQYDRSGFVASTEGQVRSSKQNRPVDFNEWLGEAFRSSMGTSWDEFAGGKKRQEPSKTDIRKSEGNLNTSKSFTPGGENKG